jgi:hypothetical protein
MKKVLTIVLGLFLLLLASCSNDNNIKEQDNSIEQLISLEFDSVNDGYYIKEVKDKYIRNITIPDTYKDKNIIGIKESAFKCCPFLTSIVLPKSLNYIGEEAFYGCYKLVEVYNLSDLDIKIEYRTNVLGYGSFRTYDYGYISYYALKIHNSLEEKSILTIDDNGFVFAYVDDIGYLVGSNSIIYDGDPILNYKLTLPKNFIYDNKIIDSYKVLSSAYYINGGINLFMPSSINAIGTFSFKNCGTVFYDGELEDWLNIKFDSLYSNTFHSLYIKDENGIQFNEGKYSYLSDLMIPDSISTIGDFQFYGVNLDSIQLGENVKKIGDYAFDGCTIKQLTLNKKIEEIGNFAFGGISEVDKIVLPNTVKAIGDYAFADNAFSEIIYEGTTEQWKEVKTGLYWLASYNIKTNKIICSNGEVELDENDYGEQI